MGEKPSGGVESGRERFAVHRGAQPDGHSPEVWSASVPRGERERFDVVDAGDVDDWAVRFGGWSEASSDGESDGATEPRASPSFLCAARLALKSS